MTAIELFQEGRLTEALQQQERLGRSNPTAISDHLLLAELFLFTGNFAEVREQLDAIPVQQPGMDDYLAAYRRLIDAEEKRQQANRPSFLMAPPDHLIHRLKALEAIRDGRPEQATIDLDEAEAQRPTVLGHIDGREFHDARDSDELLGPTLEVLHDDQYVWLPFEQIRRLKLGPIESLRDRYFVPAMLTLVDGEEWSVFFPALYAGSHLNEDDDIRVGQATDWRAEPGGPTRGVGLRVFVFGEEEMTLHDFTMWEG